jgi:hypothetical protein
MIIDRTGFVLDAEGRFGGLEPNSHPMPVGTNGWRRKITGGFF